MLLLVKYAKDIYTYIYIYFYMEENEKSSQDPAQLAHTKTPVLIDGTGGMERASKVLSA